METYQDLMAWESYYSQDDSNALFKASDFVFIEDAKPKPRHKFRSIDDDWEI